MAIRQVISGIYAVCFCFFLMGLGQSIVAQPASVTSNGSAVAARPVTIPITVRVKGTPREVELQAVDLVVTEDGEPQTLLSIRAMGVNSPLNLIVLIQDDVVSSIGLEIKPLAAFIQKLPRGSRVSVGYIRTGTLQVRQKFTSDLEKVARALRPPLGVSSAAPYNPYVEVIEALRRFDSQPAGRRAILLISDGLDISRGTSSSSAAQSVDLERSIAEAQRRSVAIYSFFAPTTTSLASGTLMSDAQSSLQRLSDETGGRAFFQGLGIPTSFEPFIAELNSVLDRQIALTYLSTHPGKGFHRIKINTSRPDVEVNYPRGYSQK
ncbi:MAG TPA: hypothetical protein VJS64_13920 [Pyrinomonadaceae bacterium]|nr:hypothetical protein [Pyrinomonadaceae bacterium]